MLLLLLPPAPPSAAVLLARLKRLADDFLGFGGLFQLWLLALVGLLVGLPPEGPVPLMPPLIEAAFFSCRRRAPEVATGDLGLLVCVAPCVAPWALPCVLPLVGMGVGVCGLVRAGVWREVRAAAWPLSSAAKRAAAARLE